MKKFLVTSISNFIDLYSKCNYDKELLRYGIEVIYLNITKILVIIIIAYFIGYVAEVLLFLILFNNLRLFGFGVHALKSRDCWLASIFCFLIVPIVSSNLVFNLQVKVILCIISFILFMLYAPAETIKRSISSNKKTAYKFLLLLIAVIYIFLCFSDIEQHIKSIIVSSLCLESFLITPIAYKLFAVPYIGKGGDKFA